MNAIDQCVEGLALDLLRNAEIKDPADVCQVLEPLGQERRLWFLRRWLFGEGGPKPEQDYYWAGRDRLTLAWHLTTSIGDLCALLRGEYVDPARLDQEWLRWAKREQFVTLKPAIDCV